MVKVEPLAALVTVTLSVPPLSVPAIVKVFVEVLSVALVKSMANPVEVLTVKVSMLTNDGVNVDAEELVTVNESVPAPPSIVSADDRPVMTALPAPPLILSLPVDTVIVSTPSPPSTVSSPAPSEMVSLPAPPVMLSFPASPLRVSFPSPPITVSLQHRLRGCRYQLHRQCYRRQRPQ